MDTPDAPRTEQTAGQPTRRGSARQRDPLLMEIGFETVNQLGGIYTVLRSKAPAMMERWGGRYCLVGPYNAEAAAVEFEPHTPTGPFGQAVKKLREWGFEAHYGFWLVTGRPRVILLDLGSAWDRLGEAKHELWAHHGIPSPDDDLVHQVIVFGYLVQKLTHALVEREGGRRQITMHFHEWMGGCAVPEVRRQNQPVGIVFTTHATVLGRYLAMNDPWFFDHLPGYDWSREANHYNIQAQVGIERAAAHGSHVFSTVSNVTAVECEHLLGRKVDVVLPNGLNIERFTALHEFQVLHRQYKERISRFVMGHFFSNYQFDLDKTLYFFTSGRYEYRNKGFDMTLEALARLNHRMKETALDRTVVMFVITKRPYHSINAEALRSQAVMEELRDTCRAIQEQIGERLFIQTAMGRTPQLDDLIDEYWRLRLRRLRQAWRTDRLPPVVTHDLQDGHHDPVLQQVHTCQLVNRPEDPVKMIYHPDFITPGNPLMGMEYDQFVRGCHLGVFPSYYEPWGYTPLECIARGVPAITSDLSGFGAFVLQQMPEHEEHGIHVTPRRNASFDEGAQRIADWMYDFVKRDRRERIMLRNNTESVSERFDWRNLAGNYDRAHEMAAEAVAARG